MNIAGRSAQDAAIEQQSSRTRWIAFTGAAVAMALLLLAGHLAVLGPARRAASVPPALATRAVRGVRPAAWG